MNFEVCLSIPSMMMIYWSNYLPRPAEIRIKNPQTLPQALYIYIYIILIYTHLQFLIFAVCSCLLLQ